MSARQLSAARAAPRAQETLGALFSYLLVGVAAALPRLHGLGVFLSGDESQFWIRRSTIFLQALRAHDWPATAISTHPGVTTMWLGSAGLLLRRALTDWGLLADQSFPTFLAILRTPAALAHVTTIVLGLLLLRRMLAPVPAALAALLWALDPFVLGFSRVLHVDALAGSFLTLSLLAACLYWHADPRLRWLLLSAVSAGLAFLSKSPALALVPWVGLVALLADQGRRTEDETGVAAVHSSFVLRLSSFAVPLVIWGGVCAATVVALWPALWASPQAAYRQIVLGVEAEGAQPHMLGNFFLGRQDDVPGPLFYPVALALRLTPWTMLGVLLLGPAWRALARRERRDLAALAGFVLLFVLALTLFPKKFNRYIEPIFPAVDVLAAVGLAWGARALAGALTLLFKPFSRFGTNGDGRRTNVTEQTSSAVFRPSSRQSSTDLQPGAEASRRAHARRLERGMLALVGLAAALNVAYWHPYEIVAFNQALGGARAGANAFTTGWGEGLGEVASWLNQQPDIEDVLTVSTMVNGLQEFMLPQAQVVSREGPLPRSAGYVVVYVRNVQWDQPWPPFDEFYGRERPLHVVQIHGVDYAWIYKAPPPAEQLVRAEFGPSIQLRGFDRTAPGQPGELLRYRMVWRSHAAPPGDLMLFAHLIGADGQRRAQADLPLPAGSWGAERYAETELALPLPADLPAGEYRLVVGLYTEAGRLPLQGASPADPALDGPDALVLDSISIEP